MNEDFLKCQQFRRYRGFTLIEVAIAVFVLASSLVILLGLQGSAMDRALRDRRKQQAMLQARRIISVYEMGILEALEGTQDDSIAAFLSTFPGGEHEDEDNLEQFRAKVEIDFADISFLQNMLGMTVDAENLKRIFVTVYWGESPLEQVQLLYFLPNHEYDPQSYAKPPPV